MNIFVLSGAAASATHLAIKRARSLDAPASIVQKRLKVLEAKLLESRAKQEDPPDLNQVSAPNKRKPIAFSLKKSLF